MAAALVQASAIQALTSGTTTVSLTGCTAGNLVILHVFERGLTGDWAGPSSPVNVNRLDGVAGLTGNAPGSNIGAGNPNTSQSFPYSGRVVANGTVSVDFTVGASGNDLFFRWYEFSGALNEDTSAEIYENAAGEFAAEEGTSTSILDAIVVTNAADRLAVQLIAVDANVAIPAFTGETGGDWTEPVAEAGSATGATATLGIQTASMPSAGTINGGAGTITSAGWSTIGFAIRPAPVVSGRAHTRPSRSKQALKHRRM